MRKLEKNKILNMLEHLHRLCKALEKQNGQDFLDLCAEIQIPIRGIREYVDKVCGKTSRLARLLRDFYEWSYGVMQGKIEVKNFSEFAYKLKRETENLKPDKIEIAFFCYKASMADSLESVYFAAKADPACDAYFIPIPYFDRRPDGGFGEMHLEGKGCYPASYELTDWESYDVQKRRPDVIFLMNPYDAQNRVTSVHPNFYSHRLKKWTELLVYIEYGLPLWIYRDAAAAYEDIKRHGIILPVYLHCDHYIAYSKEIAEFFPHLFRCMEIPADAAQKFHLDDAHVREKFVPLGSPKFDKVLGGRREMYPLPEKWKKTIGGKRIVLYNNSLAEFLKASASEAGGKAYFEKMRSVFDAFRGRNDVVLWWRPHPLFEATLHSMRKDWLDAYRSVLRIFQAAGGIFDDTADLYRAIAWSDALLSDESSLLFLYTATGKPFSVLSITKALPVPVHDTGKDFHAPLAMRLENMRVDKGANVRNWNLCIWWDNFLEEALLHNTHFDRFIERFIDYVVHRENYPEAEEYQRLQLQMVKDFVVNTDGTAGKNIYDFVKRKVLA